MRAEESWIDARRIESRDRIERGTGGPVIYLVRSRLEGGLDGNPRVVKVRAGGLLESRVGEGGSIRSGDGFRESTTAA